MRGWTRRDALRLTLALPLGAGLLSRASLAAPARQDATPTGGTNQLIVLSNSSPHVSVIDPVSREVSCTTDLPDFTAWTWNDDNNHVAEGKLWLGLRDPDTEEVEVITLDLDTLDIVDRIPIGTDPLTLYIGKASADGTLHIGKMGAGQVVAIDTATAEMLDTWDVPVNGDVVCDADISTDGDGRQRFVYPTRNGDTVVSIDPVTGETLREVETPSGATPLMLTTGGDGRIWVQETGSNTNAVFDPDLNLIERFPTGQGPIVNTFSPDGVYSYIGHGSDTFVQVIDTESLEEVTRIEVGTNPQKIAVNPGGEEIYAILTKEGSVAVIETGSWEVVERISLGTNPSGIFFSPPWYAA